MGTQKNSKQIISDFNFKLFGAMVERNLNLRLFWYHTQTFSNRSV